MPRNKTSLNYNEYPLNIYDDPVCKKYLRSFSTSDDLKMFSADEAIKMLIKSLVCKVADLGIATLLNRKWADWCENMIIKNIAPFTSNQIKRIKDNPANLFQEASLNLILMHSCAESLFENRTNNWTFMPNTIKAAWEGIKQWSLDVFSEEYEKQAKPLKDKYNSFFIIYHLAFLLHAYKILNNDMESQISTLVNQILQCAYSKQDIDEYHFGRIFENDDLTIIKARSSYRERIWDLMDSYKNENGYEVLSVYLERQVKRP